MSKIIANGESMTSFETNVMKSSDDGGIGGPFEKEGLREHEIFCIQYKTHKTLAMELQDFLSVPR